MPFFDVPDYVASDAPDVSDDTPVDFVFVDFIESDVIKFINTVQTAKTFGTADVQSYSPFLASQLLGLYAQQAWNTSS